MISLLHYLVTFYGYASALLQLYLFVFVPPYRRLVFALLKTAYRCLRDKRPPDMFDVIANMCPERPPCAQQQQQEDSDGEESCGDDDDVLYDVPPSERQTSQDSCSADAGRSKKQD